MKKLSAESFWIRKKNNSFIKKHSISIPQNNEVLVKTIYSGISYGTEKIVYSGNVPKSQRSLMRCPYQEGEFGSNVKYGYMNVGKVMNGPSKLVNRYVYTLYPHQTQYVLPLEELTFIPKLIPIKRCLLTANMETAINAMWDTLPTCGDKILIIGAGIVGFLMAYILMTIIGIEILLIDTDKEKSKIAKIFGIKFSCSIPKSYNANIIYECSGNPSVIDILSSHVNDETVICIMSWYGNSVSNINFGNEFFSKRTKILFSQVAKVSHNRDKYWNNKKRKDLAISLLNDDKLDNLIEKDMISFHDLPEFFSNTARHNKFFCKVIDYGEENV